jgi:LPPG:FO 2-phospho-L-lactate transferase
MIVALAGGVGGAKLAQGLYAELPPDTLSVIVNTGDDFDLYGLHIAPDADTVLYTLAGIANREMGWGIAGDSLHTLDMLRRYGEEMWFQLGDRDFATHILRTARLRDGWSPTRVLKALAGALDVRASLLPMCDEPVATMVQTPDRELAFQEYFVHRRQEDPVVGVRLMGIDGARVSDPVRSAVVAAEAIVFCPSNPIVSIGPILAVPGMRDLLRRASAPRVAVSPIVGGRALRGPADRMLSGLGHEVSPLGVAELYRDLLDAIVIDRVDVASVERIAALGVRVLVTETVMGGLDGRRRLAAQVLGLARELRADRAGASR